MSDDQILSITRELTALNATVGEQLKQVADLLRRHDLFLFGTPKTPGLDKRVDRMEERERRRTKHLWLIWGALLSGAASWIAGFFKGQ